MSQYPDFRNTTELAFPESCFAEPTTNYQHLAYILDLPRQPLSEDSVLKRIGDVCQ